MTDETANRLAEAMEKLTEAIDGLTDEYGAISTLSEENRKFRNLFDERLTHHIIAHTEALNKFSENH